MKVETIHRLCGSESSPDRMRDFRRELRDSLTKVEEATGWKWDINDGDLVKIKKPQQQLKRLKK